MTQVLLAQTVVPRRADAVAVIGAGLEIAASGMGHRPIAERLGRTESTVRGWLRAFRSRAEEVRRFFTVAQVALAVDPDPPRPAGSAVGDAVFAVMAAAEAAAARWPGIFTVSRWEFACRCLHGGLLTCVSSGR
ncbi:helix-turn-helix domain-containing protein [Streptomyces sp. 6N223]|uniref:helix-turn-helix domain-containing protein n=1 Tax=Streptomyces sp. 6N223 TaxID=3457412 RepID=UPI003FD5B8A9